MNFTHDLMKSLTLEYQTIVFTFKMNTDLKKNKERNVFRFKIKVYLQIET